MISFVAVALLPILALASCSGLTTASNAPATLVTTVSVDKLASAINSEWTAASIAAAKSTSPVATFEQSLDQLSGSTLVVAGVEFAGWRDMLLEKRPQMLEFWGSFKTTGDYWKAIGYEPKPGLPVPMSEAEIVGFIQNAHSLIYDLPNRAGSSTSLSLLGTGQSKVSGTPLPDYIANDLAYRDPLISGIARSAVWDFYEAHDRFPIPGAEYGAILRQAVNAAQSQRDAEQREEELEAEAEETDVL